MFFFIHCNILVLRKLFVQCVLDSDTNSTDYGVGRPKLLVKFPQAVGDLYVFSLFIHYFWEFRYMWRAGGRCGNRARQTQEQSQMQEQSQTQQQSETQEQSETNVGT